MSLSPFKNGRMTELGDIFTTGTTGFVVRKRTGIGLFFHFFLLACMIFFGCALLLYYHSPAGCVLGIAIGIGYGIVAHNLESQKKMKEALEFMNALFSSAMGKGYKCVFIVKNTGDIVFYNRPFQAIFPAYIAQSTRKLEILLALYNVLPADSEKLLQMMDTKTEGTIATSIREGESGEAQPLTLQLENIERPTGFFLIRGK